MRDLSLNFSRPGGQVVAQYYNFLRLGREGYRKVHAACYDTAAWLAKEIAALGPFEMLYGGDPATGIPRFVGRSRTAPTPASPSSTSPTASACAAGRCPPTPCRRSARRRPCSASSSATA